MRAAVLALALIAAATGQQTQVRARQIAAAGPGPSVEVIKLDGTRAIAVLDSSLTLDESTSPPTLRAKVPSTRDVWGETLTATGTMPTWTLNTAPLTGTLRLHLNGIRLTAGVDYTIAGSVITFIGKSTPQAAEVLCADYRF